MTDRHTTAREMFEERAAILQFEAGLTRGEAERLAKIEAATWLKMPPDHKRS